MCGPSWPNVRRTCRSLVNRRCRYGIDMIKSCCLCLHNLWQYACNIPCTFRTSAQQAGTTVHAAGINKP